LLYDRTQARAMGQRARQVFEEQAGATARCVEGIEALLRRRVLACAAQEPRT